MTRRMSTTRRVRIFDTAGGLCHLCERKIRVGEAWDVEHVIPYALTRDDSDENLRPAHVGCHKAKTKDDVATIAKAKRVSAKHRGAKAPSRNPIPGSKASGLKRKMNGEIVKRDAP